MIVARRSRTCWVVIDTVNEVSVNATIHIWVLAMLRFIQNAIYIRSWFLLTCKGIGIGPMLWK